MPFKRRMIMRRSLAPSLKIKLPSVTVKEDKNYNQTCAANSKDLNGLRSTTSVLNLLLNSVDSSEDELKLEKSASFSPENNPNISNTTECFGEKAEIDLNAFGDNNPEELRNGNSESCVKIFNVVYGKQTKRKHKTWEGDGILEINSKYMTLKNEDGKILGTQPCFKSRKLLQGMRIYVSSKEVELLDEVDVKNKSDQFKSPVKKKNDTVGGLITEGLLKSKPGLIKNRRFLSSTTNYTSGLALPQPNPQHQWYFNQKGLPLSPVYIEAGLSKKLREHQKAGVTFLYESIMGFKDCNLTGAILADEMGLGKTLQCITLIWTLLKQGPYGNIPAVRKVLIVTPSSLTMNWFNEFMKWLGRAKVLPFCVDQKNKPSKMKGPIMIISYEMLVRHYEDVEKHNFDLLICDEGHRLKNTNIRTTQLLQNFNCRKRILLTGTPIQNDLQEFYSLVDFVNPNVLGSPSEFRERYMEPIIASRQPNADKNVLAKGKECSQDLKRVTCKFLLRRTREILNNYLPPRYEVVVFCQITDLQKQIYNLLINYFIGLKQNNLGVSDKFSPLELIMTLRKVCNHPCLLKHQNYEQVGCILKNLTNDVPLAEMSTKVIVTVNFLKELKESSAKEKVILVSVSTQTLDVLGEILDSYGFTSCRLDGSTSTARRNDIVERFNASFCNTFVFLLSAKAGGVGLNLTGASRLILFDSDWNPATDLQAIARIWRDGQKFPVFIYRLLTAGTIEEKIYQRQISKQGLCEGTVDPESEKSIKLSNEELKDLFSSCSLEKECLTHDMLSCDCNKRGEIPIPETEPEERKCQLMKQFNSSIKISELFHWEHHGRPFESDFLSQLCLKKSENKISFIFRTCKN